MSVEQKPDWLITRARMAKTRRLKPRQQLHEVGLRRLQIRVPEGGLCAFVAVNSFALKYESTVIVYVWFFHPGNLKILVGRLLEVMLFLIQYI